MKNIIIKILLFLHIFKKVPKVIGGGLVGYENSSIETFVNEKRCTHKLAANSE